MFSRSLRTSLFSLMLVLALAFGAAAQYKTGANVDEVIITEEPSAEKAYSRLVAGDIDLYAHSVSNAAVFADVKNSPNLDYYTAFGSYSELTFNTVGPYFDDGRLNPFNSRRVREAMNWLVDRDYIAQELYGGLASPKYTVLTDVFADYARVVEKARELETIYAYDLGKAEEVISEEMLAMGAQLVNGKWNYNGQPIVINVLIRIEDARLDVGDYVADQLEKIGFVTSRDYKNSVDSSPIWLSGDPHEGRWHVFTGGWSSPMVYRDQSHNFDQMYTTRIMDYPPFQALEPIPELDELSETLYFKRFSSMEERNELLGRTLELGFQDSPRIFLVDIQGFVPRRDNISVASDLGGQVAGTLLWAPTIQRTGSSGGSIHIALPSVLVDPWNPVAGSNSLYDQMAIRGTMERSTMTDPYTGNMWPNRVERAEVYVREGLPVARNLDWVDLYFVEDNHVPEDAWVDWDAKEQRFITAAEKFPEGTTATRRSVVYFPEDFYETVKWHDGSPVSLGDIMFWFILGFDRGKPDSAIFDPAQESPVEASLKSFKGMRILSKDPLIIESFSDTWSLDAEYMVGEHFPVDINLGPGAWHNIALGVRIETNNELAFSASKAAELKVDQMGFHTGPAISVMARELDKAKAEAYIPYAKVLSEFISADEVAARYDNLSKWYQDKGHFWLGTGVLYLDRVYPVERMIVLKRNPDHPDASDKWAMFDEPRIPEIEVVSDVRLRVRQGSELKMTVKVTFDGEAYPSEHIDEVKYIVQDARGKVALSGYAQEVGEGLYEVTLLPSQTRGLPIGANRLDAIVVSKLVGGAQFGGATFVTTP